MQTHPAEVENDGLVLRLLETLPYDGLEIYHPSARDKNIRAFWMREAVEHSLLVTGGSDYHGNAGRFPEQLDEWPVPRATVQDFLCRFGL